MALKNHHNLPQIKAIFFATYNPILKAQFLALLKAKIPLKISSRI
ncbi:hypothetical protein [Bartonella grahamii]|nr:hypothetical protein [Bartonella grahamii]